MTAQVARTPLERRLLSVSYLLALVLLFANSFFHHAFFQTWNHIGPDWPIFLSASQALSRGESPYPADLLTRGPARPDGTGWEDYIYPPLFARIVGLLAPLGPFGSMKFYLLVCLSLYLWFFFPRWDRGGTGWTVFGLQSAVLFSWGPVIQNFRHGQSDFVALFLFASAWRILGREERGQIEPRFVKVEWLAGIALGFSFGIKLTPALVVPLFLAAGSWRIVTGFLAAAAISGFLPDPFASYQYFMRVLPTLLADLSVMEGRPALHLALSNVFDRFLLPFFRIDLGPRAVSILGILASGTVYGCILLAVVRKKRRYHLSDLLLVSCFLPPVFAANLRHHFALTILPVLVGIRRIIKDRGELETKGEEGEEAGPPAFRAALSLAVLALALFPTFYYTLPVRTLSFLYGEGRPIPLNQYITLGQLVALGVLWPYLLPVRKRGEP